MTENKQSDSDQTVDASMSVNPMLNEAEAFCRMMERLNAISLQQMQGLLTLGVRVAENFHSPSSQNYQDITEYMKRMKEDVESLNAKTSAGLQSIKNSEGENISQIFEQALTDAVQNSVACQQMLNILGVETLSWAIHKMLPDMNSSSN